MAPNHDTAPPNRVSAPDVSMVRLCRWLLRYAVRRRAAFAGVLATLLLASGLNLLKPWPMKIVVDYVLYGKEMPPGLTHAVDYLPGSATPHNLLAWSIAGTVVLFLLGWLLGVATSYANIAFGQRMVYDLAGDLFAHLQRLSLRFHRRKSVGDSIRRVTTDSSCVSTILKDALLPVVSSLFSLAAMFLVMWRMDAGLTLLSLTVIPFMVLSFRRYSEPLLERSYEQQEVEGKQYTIVEETLSAIPVIQAFGGEEDADTRFRENTSSILRATLAATRVQLQFRVLTGMATAVGTAGILWLGAHRVLEGQLTIGSILVFLAYLGMLYGPVETMMYVPSTIQSAAGNARRVLEVLEAPVDVEDCAGAVPLGPVRGQVRLEGVSFGYGAERPVLQDISMEALPGQTIAIVGATGAGKSTLVGLLPRFFDPWQGRVLIDGKDVRDVQLKSLRNQISLVLQEPFLFPLSIAENIAYGRPDASREQIQQAARAANAHDFIVRLPEGYDTVIGERGATLSGGERQRISIARALLKDAPILILDEPTSALDAETEALLLEALERLMEGRTTLIIAHRLSTIRNADRIIVLKDGTIQEQGSHQELLQQGGAYMRLYRLQFSRTDASHTPGEALRT